MTVEEREELEVLAARATAEGLADSRVKYEAVRILAKSRLGRSLPAWRSEPFGAYREYFEDYSGFVDAVHRLLTPFAAEVDEKKTKRQAQVLEALGDVKALKALIQAFELTMKPFYSALERLEADGVTES